MANRMWQLKVQHLQKGLTIYSGKFRPNGSSAIATYKGKGYLPVRTGVGTIEIRLKKGDAAVASATAEKFTDSVKETVTLQEGTFGTNIAILEAFDPATGIAVVKTATRAAPTVAADIASGANNWIHFDFHLVN